MGPCARMLQSWMTSTAVLIQGVERWSTAMEIPYHDGAINMQCSLRSGIPRHSVHCLLYQMMSNRRCEAMCRKPEIRPCPSNRDPSSLKCNHHSGRNKNETDKMLVARSSQRVTTNRNYFGTSQYILGNTKGALRYPDGRAA